MKPLLTSLLAVALTFSVATAAAQVPQRKITQPTGLDQRLGHQVPLDLAFRDEKGSAVELRR